MSATECERDLGVLVDRELKFHQHTTRTVKKADQLLGLIPRSFTTRNQRLIMPLYKTMVRPILEYGRVVWGPTYATDTLRIEHVQLEGHSTKFQASMNCHMNTVCGHYTSLHSVIADIGTT